MHKHVQIIGILYLILSCISLGLAFFIHYLLNLIGAITGDQDANFILSIVANVLSTVLFASSIPGIIGAIGLLKFKEWGRILIIIISVINLLNFPIGTALGGYSIWALVQPETLSLFNKQQTEIS
ncbi:hypothetical protein [Mangrovibacterium sp.]|uniref:hypothetical protein n=1 Tax=Mangrovibacterium sp. TaxID=1961364 RepID=UPI00356B2894